jgi:adenosylcobyric acid synthase
MGANKTTKQVTFQFEGQACQGYEIHQGVSDTDEAILQTDHCIGTYIHGFLDNAPVINHILRGKGIVKSERLRVGDGTSGMKFASATSYADFKEEQYNKLAAHIRQYVDIERIYQILSSND